MNENKTPAPAGIYNCAFVGACRSKRKLAANHFVMNVRIRPLGCGVDENEVCEYWAEIPLCYKIGEDFGFYDKQTNANIVRKATAKDTEAAINYARKCFPAWSEYVDALPDSASWADAFAWFDETRADVIVKAKIREISYYPDENGVQHPRYQATIYELGGASTLLDDADSFNAEFGKSLKASGARFGGAKSAAKPTPIQAAARAAKASLKQATPPAPKTPAPKPKSNATRDDAWAAYYNSRRFVNDPQGDRFDSDCCEIVGDFPTSGDDWQKCIDRFNAEPVNG